MGLEPPPMTTSAADCLATESYSNPPSAETGLLCIIEATATTVIIDKDGIRSTLYVERGTVAPTAKEMKTEDNKTQTNKNDSERKVTHAGDIQLEEERLTSAPREYDVDPIVINVGRS